VRRSLTHDALLTRTSHHKARLLLFGVDWFVWIADTTATVREVNWVKVPGRIQFRLCVLRRRCLHDTAPPYLTKSMHLTTDVDACRRFRSASTSTRRSTLGDRAFPVAAARAWNNLPHSVRFTTSLALFRQQLKTMLFEVSYGPENYRRSAPTDET